MKKHRNPNEGEYKDRHSSLSSVTRNYHQQSSDPLQEMLKNPRYPSKLHVLVIAFIVVIVLSTILLSLFITDATNQLKNAWKDLDRILVSINNSRGTDLTLDDLTRLQTSLDELGLRVETARARAAYIQWLGINTSWAASFKALDISQNLIAATDNMLEGLEPTLDFIAQGERVVASSTGERIVELLGLGHRQFLAAQEDLNQAAAQLDRIALDKLPSDLLLQIEQLRNYREQLADLNTILLDSPDLLTNLLGLDEERAYLVLAQNNDEIRPSGGYISAYGWVTIHEGRITDHEYSPTTSMNPNPPNDTFLEMVYIPEWWIQYRKPIYAAWEGSWYTDFPSTARLAMDYYNAGDNPQIPVKGVIAIDSTGVELLLGALGEVSVEDGSRAVTADNFRELLYDMCKSGQDENLHKEFIAATYYAIFTEWRNIQAEQIPDLLRALFEGVRSKHILIFFDDEPANQAVARLRWNGAQFPGIDYDYLLVADANLGNKSNHSIDRSIIYDVQIQPNHTLQSRLNIHYEYYAAVAEQDPAIDAQLYGALDYHNIMQIFLPSGSQLFETSVPDELTPIDTGSHLLLVARTEVAYNSNEWFQFVYETPQLIHEIGSYQRYRLLVQKQPGARMQSVTVQVALPPGSRLIDATPAANISDKPERPIVEFQLALDRDIWLEIIYQAK